MLSVQRAQKKFENLAKQDPVRARQKSQVRAGTNFSQSRTIRLGTSVSSLLSSHLGRRLLSSPCLNSEARRGSQWTSPMNENGTLWTSIYDFRALLLTRHFGQCSVQHTSLISWLSQHLYQSPSSWQLWLICFIANLQKTSASGETCRESPHWDHHFRLETWVISTCKGDHSLKEHRM